VDWPRRLARIGFTVAAVSVIGSSCGQAVGDSGGSGSDRPASTVAQSEWFTTVVGDSAPVIPVDRESIDAAVDPERYGIAKDSRWLTFVMGPSPEPDAVIGEWMAHVDSVSAALDASATGAPPVAGLNVYQRQDDGDQILIIGGVIDSNTEADVVPTMTREEAIATIDASARDLGLTVDSISFPTAGHLQAAPVVKATTQESATKFLQNHPFALHELGFGRQEPGLIEVSDSDGSPIEVAGAIPGVGFSVQWNPPKFGCFGLCPPTGES
jgi:hypothetical protein